MFQYTFWWKQYTFTQKDYEKLFATREFQWYIAYINHKLKVLWNDILRWNNSEKLVVKFDWYEIDRRLYAFLLSFKRNPIVALQADLQWRKERDRKMKQQEQYKINQMKGTINSSNIDFTEDIDLGIADWE